jgi:hypothetical protein
MGFARTFKTEKYVMTELHISQRTEFIVHSTEELRKNSLTGFKKRF